MIISQAVHKCSKLNLAIHSYKNPPKKEMFQKTRADEILQRCPSADLHPGAEANVLRNLKESLQLDVRYLTKPDPWLWG